MKLCQLPSILLVALAVVAFAGCTSPTLVSTVSYSGDSIIGTWNWVPPGGSSNPQVYYAFAEDGTFTRTDKRDSTKHLYSGTWSKPDNNTYALVYKGENPGFNSENLYLLNQTGRLRNDSNDFFQKAT